eukprot:gene18666-biopygen5572
MDNKSSIPLSMNSYHEEIVRDQNRAGVENQRLDSHRPEPTPWWQNPSWDYLHVHCTTRHLPLPRNIRSPEQEIKRLRGALGRPLE